MPPELSQWISQVLRDILQHFMDVLQINIFVIDPQGQIIVPPFKGGYGAGFLENKTLGFGLESKEPTFLKQFEKQGGGYLEYRNRLLPVHHFAIPINVENGKDIAYVIVGPVILNKRLDSVEYKVISEKLKFDYDHLMKIAHEIRVVSYPMIKSILDLLSEVSKYVVQLNFQGPKFSKLSLERKNLPPEVSKAARDIYTSICLDELLVALLDVVLNITQAECGSIMTLDPQKRILTIKVSRGINTERAETTHLKLGEGIAGLAAKENTPFVIKGVEGDERIKHLLKRPEIQHALIIPIYTQNRVYGVLNLHTKLKDNNITDESLHAVQNLSRVTSTAINSIP